MITIFNRRELTVTFSLSKQAEIRSLLAENEIDYIVRTINRKSPSPPFASSRARTGTFGENLDVMYEYIFYVKKQDYEKARHFLFP